MSFYQGDGGDSEEEGFSVIGDKGKIGFIDFADDKSVACCDDSTEKGPVVISFPFPLLRGKTRSVFAGEIYSHPITIENTSCECVDLWGVQIFCSNPVDSFTLSLLEPPSPNSTMAYIQGFLEGFCMEDRVLVPYKTLTIWLSCKPKEIGLHTCIVHFDIGDERIERVVFLLAEDKVSRSLASANKRCHSRVQRRISFPGDNVYPAALRPAKAKKHGLKSKLPQFEIPEDTRELLEKKLVPAVIKEGLTKENYAEYFSTLLIMEELHLEIEMRNHDIDGATMRRKGAHFLALEVLGLAERRPSLLQGDHVLATLVSRNANDTSPAYQGVICRIEANEVLLKFPKVFHANHQHENIYNIQFTYNRVCMRRLYQAIKATENLESCILFPSKSTERSLKTSTIVPLMSLNEEQLRCVEMILRCDGSPPYIIHGPPGTGKTTTLVAAILQLYATREEARILVCAASNSAADHILEKLIENNVAKVKENNIFRLNASSRAYEDVNPNILRFSYSGAYIFKCPPLKALLHYKLIITTYMSSSILYAEGFGRDHFSHIFLDETGQSSEPETMVPLSSLSRKETVVVLAGDPAQLGPVVYSNKAVKYGLGKSYLERLFECELYRNEEHRFITRLLRNYRCHPTILDLPSKLFYEGTLIASKHVSPSPKSWLNILPSKEFNVLFIGIQGSDERQGNNPSWFNRIEASKVIDLVKKLTDSTDLSDSDVGVIAPYRQQVAKISEALETLEFSDVKVGTVEQFQGQEREVIIVSTVRSTAKHNTFDRTHSIGFLSNPRRFNVAITRAKSLLIVVGNPHIVSMDPYWHKLLWYCADNNSYQGCPLPER